MAQAFRKSSLKGRHLGIQRILTNVLANSKALQVGCARAKCLCSVMLGLSLQILVTKQRHSFIFYFFFVLPYMIFSLYPGQTSGVAAGLYANLYVPRDK